MRSSTPRVSSRKSRSSSSNHYTSDDADLLDSLMRTATMHQNGGGAAVTDMSHTAPVRSHKAERRTQDRRREKEGKVSKFSRLNNNASSRSEVGSSSSRLSNDLIAQVIAQQYERDASSKQTGMLLKQSQSSSPDKQRRRREQQALEMQKARSKALADEVVEKIKRSPRHTFEEVDRPWEGIKFSSQEQYAYSKQHDVRNSKSNRRSRMGQGPSDAAASSRRLAQVTAAVIQQQHDQQRNVYNDTRREMVRKEEPPPLSRRKPLKPKSMVRRSTGSADATDSHPEQVSSRDRRSYPFDEAYNGPSKSVTKSHEKQNLLARQHGARTVHSESPINRRQDNLEFDTFGWGNSNGFDININKSFKNNDPFTQSNDDAFGMGFDSPDQRLVDLRKRASNSGNRQSRSRLSEHDEFLSAQRNNKLLIGDSPDNSFESISFDNHGILQATNCFEDDSPEDELMNSFTASNSRQIDDEVTVALNELASIHPELPEIEKLSWEEKKSNSGYIDAKPNAVKSRWPDKSVDTFSQSPSGAYPFGFAKTKEQVEEDTESTSTRGSESRTNSLVNNSSSVPMSKRWRDSRKVAPARDGGSINKYTDGENLKQRTFSSGNYSGLSIREAINLKSDLHDTYKGDDNGSSASRAQSSASASSSRFNKIPLSRPDFKSRHTKPSIPESSKFTGHIDTRETNASEDSDHIPISQRINSIESQSHSTKRISPTEISRSAFNRPSETAAKDMDVALLIRRRIATTKPKPFPQDIKPKPENFAALRANLKRVGGERSHQSSIADDGSINTVSISSDDKSKSSGRGISPIAVIQPEAVQKSPSPVSIMPVQPGKLDQKKISPSKKLPVPRFAEKMSMSFDAAAAVLMKAKRHQSLKEDGASPIGESGDSDQSTAQSANVEEPRRQAQSSDSSDPRYEKYFKMLKVGLPLEAVKHSILRDGLDPSYMDNPTPKPSTQPPKPSVKDDPKYEKYFKMLKVGLPMGAVKNALLRDGLDQDALDDISSDGTSNILENKSAQNQVALKDDPKYEKYFKMLKLKLPIGAVKQAMVRDGLDPNTIDNDPNKPSSGTAKEGKITAKAKVKDTHRRTRIHWETVQDANVGEDTVWAIANDDPDIDDIDIDEQEFDTLFKVEAKPSQSTPVTKSSNSTSNKRGAKVIDPKRANNGGIILARIKATYDEIANAIEKMDESLLTTHQLQSIIQYLPDKEERTKLRDYICEGDGDSSRAQKINSLCECEKFMYSIIGVKDPERKIKCLAFKTQFESNINNIRKDVGTVTSACEELRYSKKLAKLLGIVLSLGNRLNTAGQNTERRKAGAITLDSLSKLNQAKAVGDKQMTFLHYVVLVVRRNSEELLKFHEDLGSVFASQKIHWEITMSDLEKAEAQLDDMRRMALQMCPGKHNLKNHDLDELSLHEEIELLKSTPVGIFAIDAFSKTTAVRDEAFDTEKQFVKLLEYFGEKSKMLPHEMFEIFVNFSRDIKKAVEEVERMDKIKQREQKAKAPRRSFGTSSLSKSKNHHVVIERTIQEDEVLGADTRDTSASSGNNREESNYCGREATSNLQHHYNEGVSNGVGDHEDVADSKRPDVEFQLSLD